MRVCLCVQARTQAYASVCLCMCMQTHMHNLRAICFSFMHVGGEHRCTVHRKTSPYLEDCVQQQSSSFSSKPLRFESPEELPEDLELCC